MPRKNSQHPRSPQPRCANCHAVLERADDILCRTCKAAQDRRQAR